MRIDKNRIKVTLPTGMSLFGDWQINNDTGEATIQIKASEVGDNQRIEVQYDGAPVPPFAKTINVRELQFNVTIMNGDKTISVYSVEKGSQFARPTSDPVVTGHTFVNYYTDPELTEVATFPFTVTANTTIYTKFSINSYTCTIIDGDDIISTETFEYGAQWSPAQNRKPNFISKGIFMDRAFKTPAHLPIFVDGDKTVYLKYAPASKVRFYKDKYCLSVDLVAEISVETGKTMNAIDIPAGLTFDGLTWGGWGYGSSASDFNQSVVINGDTSVYGRWTPHNIHFTVTFNANRGAYSNGTDTLEVRGTTHTTFPMPSDYPMLEGGEFAGYSLNPNDYKPQIPLGQDIYPANGTPDDPDRVYYAIYNRAPADIDVHMMDEDTEFKVVNGEEGSLIRLAGVPKKAGFDFAKWTANPDGSGISYGPNGDAVVWVLSTYNGKDVISQEAHYEGDTVDKLPSPEMPDMNFVGWYNEPVFETRTAFPITMDRSVNLYAKFIKKEYIYINYKTEDGKQTYKDRVEKGFEYAVSNCLPAFTNPDGKCMIIHKWKYINAKGEEEIYYPGQKFPYDAVDGMTFVAVPISENIVKPDVGIIYLYGTPDITDTNPKRMLFSYKPEELEYINRIPQKVATEIIKDYLRTNGQMIDLLGFTRVTYEQYSGPTSIYSVGDRMSKVGDEVGTFTTADLGRENKPTYVMVAKYDVIGHSALVTFDPAGGTPEYYEDQIVAVGDRVTPVTKPTKENSRFVGWSLDLFEVVNLYTYKVPEGSHELKFRALWENLCDVEFDVDGGTPNILPVKVYEGDTIPPVVNPTKEGYEFIGWSYNGAVIDLVTFKCPIGGLIAPIKALWRELDQ